MGGSSRAFASLGRKASSFVVALTALELTGTLLPHQCPFVFLRTRPYVCALTSRHISDRRQAKTRPPSGWFVPFPPALSNKQTAITSKDKKQGFGPFGDVYEEAYGGGDPAGPGVGGGITGEPTATGPPPTFLVPLLHPQFLSEDGVGVSAR